MICLSDVVLTHNPLDEPPSYSLFGFLISNNGLYLFITALLLLFTGLLSVVESALFSLREDDIHTLRNGKDRRGKIVLDLLKNPRLLLSVLTAWKYVSLISASVIFTIAARLTDQSGLITEVVALTIALAFFGVIIPKVYGTTRNTALALSLGKFCKGLMKITRPFIAPLIKMSFTVEQKLEKLAEESSVKELTQALELVATDEKTTADEKEILRGIVNFGTLSVRQVMRPKEEIHCADISLNFHDLLLYIKKSGFSRIPVYHESLDKIEGVLYIKDLLPFLEESKKFDWKRLIRPAYFVAENKKIDLLLKDFQEKRVHMALVINDAGSVSGIITLEDLIEEIIGDIHDEFDEVGAYYKKIDEKTLIVDSKIPVHEFCRLVDVDPVVFAHLNVESETLGRVLQEIHDELPKIGDQIVLDPFTFTIEAVDHKRIKKIKVNIHEEKEHP
jgi:putative hemolysin